jgi:hypothetical protein
MNEGIFTASASKQRKIFSQVTKAKKEIFKNASETKPIVKEENQMPSFQQLRSSLEEKTLTPAEKTKREEIAKAMERENPGMPMAKKMAIATAQAKKVTEAKDSREYDYEGDMSKSQLRSIIANAQTVHDMLEDNTNMAEWVQSKITLAADYISTVADYMQSEVNEAVTVKKADYSWGKMMTVHHGSDTSYPLHPEHQQAIAKLGDGEKTSFKDETNSTVHAHREGDTVHLTRPKTSSTKTSVAHSNFNEEVEQIDELDKSTLSSYIKKASRSAADNANYAGFERERHGSDSKEERPRTYGVAAKVASRRLKGIEKASDRLVGKKTLKDEGTRTIVRFKSANTSTFKDNAEKVADIGKSIKRNHADKVHSVGGDRETGNGYTELKHSSHADAVKEHIKKSGGKIVSVRTMAGGHYNESVETVLEAENPCWDGYKMLGMKDNGGKKVPNCIPEEQHYCAKHVYSNMFGEGLVVEGIHAEPDEEGNVEWYAVQFNEGIKKVFTEKLEIMMAEFHGNHKKKKRMTNG